MLEPLIDRFRQKDRRALSQLLTLVARGENVNDVLDKVGPPSRPARIVAFTGAAGVGKSTLLGKLIGHLRQKNQTVAVLACDPQSPISGGALLGDRVRMPSQPDDGVFIRSLAAVSGHGALAKHLDALVQVTEAFGFDNIFIETVGAGQGDTDVHDLADVVVLLLQPESGDDIQGDKAGLLEVADIVAIHKADLPGAEQALAQVQNSLALSANRAGVPVLRVSGRTGEGVEALWAAIEKCASRRQVGARRDRDLIRLAQEEMERRLGAFGSDLIWRDLAERWRAGKLTRSQAVAEVWRYLGRNWEK
jgi:LAO/AO transport system kinase